MRTVIVVLAAVVLLAATVGAQQSAPVGAVNLVILGSWAPLGIGGELFLGNAGVGVIASVLPFALGGDDVEAQFVYELGAYGRLYLGPVHSSLYVAAGAGYMSAFGGLEISDVADVDIAQLKFYGSIGYNVLFGQDNRTRLCVDIGARYATWLAEGDTVDAVFPVFPRFTLMLGRAF